MSHHLQDEVITIWHQAAVNTLIITLGFYNTVRLKQFHEKVTSINDHTSSAVTSRNLVCHPISNHHQFDSLFKSLFRLISKKKNLRSSLLALFASNAESICHNVATTSSCFYGSYNPPSNLVNKLPWLSISGMDIDLFTKILHQDCTQRQCLH